MRRISTGLYGFGIINVMLMTGYHIYLPEHLNWVDKMEGITTMLQWSLITLNFDWSVMALMFSSMLFFMMFKPHEDYRTKRLVSNVHTMFWAAHGVYIYFNLPQFPEHLSWIPMLMLAFPIVITSLLFLGNWVFTENTKTVRP